MCYAFQGKLSLRGCEPLIEQHHAACNWVGTKMIIRSTCQILQTVRKDHAFQILVQILSRSQTVRRGHTYQTLVEFITKSQTDKALGKRRRFHVQMRLSSVLRLPRKTLLQRFQAPFLHAACNWVGTKMIIRSTCQILQTVRKCHAFQILVEVISRSQTVRQGHTYQTLVEFITKSQTDKALWKTKKVACSSGVAKCVTPSKENSASDSADSVLHLPQMSNSADSEKRSDVRSYLQKSNSGDC